MKKRRTELLTIILGLSGLIGWVSIASAQGGPKKAEPPHITNAVVFYELSPPEIQITGENLKDDLQHPAVSLGGTIATGGVELVVTESTPGFVRALLPVDWELTLSPGDHLLVLDSRVGDTTPTEFMLTLGTTGPQGPKGDPGADGQNGADGTSCSVGKVGDTATISCNGTTADVTDGAVGPAGADGADGAAGAPGIQGPAGQACWDLNGDGVENLATEDFNGDGSVDVNDCKGDQVINLTVEIPEVPGLVAQDFVTIFPEASKNTTYFEVTGPNACGGFGVIVNGPGVEIEVIPGFGTGGQMDNHSGTAQELPLVVEVYDDPGDIADCASQLNEWFTLSPGSPGFVDIVTQQPDGTEVVRWSYIYAVPTNEEPGFDGRTRFTFEVLEEFSGTGASIPNPNNILTAERLYAPFQSSEFPSDTSENPLTDKNVQIQGIVAGEFPAVELEDAGLVRLTLVYDAVEASTVFDWVRRTVEIGSAADSKRDVQISDGGGGSGTGTFTTYRQCFPIRWEQFTGFRQFPALKERVILQCDYIELL